MHILRKEAFSAPPAAILFDLDHTFYDYNPAHQAAIDATREKLQRALNVTSKQFDIAFGEARAIVKRRLGATASSHSRLLYFQNTVEILGFGSQLVLALDLEQTYWRTFLSAAKIAPGSEDLLIELRAQGIKLGIVTDLTAQIQFRKLTFFNLDRYFDAIVTSEEAGSDKIGLKPFRLILEKLGLQKADKIWMIGDSTDDIVGARQSIDAVTLQRVWGGRDNVHSEADASFEDFRDLSKFIGNFFKN